MRTVAVVTVARSDYGICLPVLREISVDPDLRLRLMATGMHLSPEYGLTVRAIEEDGFEVADRVEMLLSSDTPEGIAKSMGMGTIGFAQAYSRSRPDLLVLLGDRFEMHAAAVASLPFKIPLAHIHGGESTEGLIDESIRHSITKMSHLHFVATEAYRQRVIQMGEEPWRVVLSGAPSLDNLRTTPPLGARELESAYGLDLLEPPLLVTFHPVTLEYERTEEYVEQLLAALGETGSRVVFTCPNADTRGRLVMEMIRNFAQANERASLVDNLGTRAYFSLMSHASAMVGNSSSGIIEAASFKLPVVNIGNRQQGRIHGKNVIDVGCTSDEILAGIRQATSSEFRANLDGLANPYGEGRAAEKIVAAIRAVELDDLLLIKRFHRIGDTG